VLIRFVEYADGPFVLPFEGDLAFGGDVELSLERVQFVKDWFPCLCFE